MLKVLELPIGLRIKVSDNGDIYSLPHKMIRSNGRIDNRKGRKIKPATDRYGYHRVAFSHQGKRMSAYVHRLVAMAFIPNPENKETVNHINGNKTDNRVCNLEWATQKEQKLHSIAHHLCDKNLSALALANKKRSKKVEIGGKIYPSVKCASRELGISEWSVGRRGVFL